MCSSLHKLVALITTFYSSVISPNDSLSLALRPPPNWLWVSSNQLQVLNSFIMIMDWFSITLIHQNVSFHLVLMYTRVSQPQARYSSVVLVLLKHKIVVFVMLGRFSRQNTTLQMVFLEISVLLLPTVNSLFSIRETHSTVHPTVLLSTHSCIVLWGLRNVLLHVLLVIIRSTWVRDNALISVLMGISQNSRVILVMLIAISQAISSIHQIVLYVPPIVVFWINIILTPLNVPHPVIIRDSTYTLMWMSVSIHAPILIEPSMAMTIPNTV
jgi:hypothetical protein